MAMAEAHPDWEDMHWDQMLEKATVTDERRDPECSDVVAVYARREGELMYFGIRVGHSSRVITKAFASLLETSVGQGGLLSDIMAVPEDLLGRLVGEPMGDRASASNTYLVRRMKETVKKLWV